MVFKISDFSEELFDLENLSNWPTKVKVMQKLIGKSFGCKIDFKIIGSEDVDKIKCYTTRPDTLFGFFLHYQLIIPCLNFMKMIKNF